MCDSTQRIIVSKSHENTSKYVDTVTFFAKKTWTKGHWPLDDLWPQICWGHMCDSTQGSLCPSPMKIYQSMWIQWTFFAKTWSKGHWPLDDLWPQICWGHMCDSTQGSLCPSPMGIHQCMRIQWSILQKLTTYITHTTYTYYVQNQWSHSLFLNYVQARQKSKPEELGFMMHSNFIARHLPMQVFHKKKRKVSLKEEINRLNFHWWGKGLNLKNTSRSQDR